MTKEREKHAFESRKKTPHPQSKFRPIPRRFPTHLHKRLQKIEAQFEKVKDQPVARARLLKQAASLIRRVEGSKNEE